jgi:hypothetical protein
MRVNEGVGQAIQSRYDLMESCMKDKNRTLVEYKSGGRTHKKTMGSLIEQVQAEHGDHIAGQTALLLENQRAYYADMDEATKLAYVGTYDRWAFDAVATVWGNTIAQEVVSTQVMDGPSALLFFIKFVAAITKGSTSAGEELVTNPNRHFMSRTVDDEVIATGDGTDTYSGNLDWLPVIAGTVTITAGAQVLVDDGAGTLSGNGSGTINYVTGAWTAVFTSVVASGVSITCYYEYDNEGTTQLPKLDMVLDKEMVEAETVKVLSEASLEAISDFKKVNGLDAMAELIGAQISEQKFEIDNLVIYDLIRIAQNTQAKWDATPGTGVSYTEHKLSFRDTFTKGSNKIYGKTQRARASWAIIGLEVANVMETLPGFKADMSPISGRGVQLLGMYGGRKVFVDTYLPEDFMLLGHKGDNMWDTGYIFAMYEMFRQTPDIELPDMMRRKGTWSRFARKVVDGGFYCVSGIKNYS